MAASHRHFVIAGAQRSGTTYLYRLLEQHPDIEMARPMQPEPKFFLDEGLVSRGLEAYESLFFGHRPDATVRGEKSTSYIENEAAAQRIHRLLPDAQVVFVLREPLARAVSNYRFSVDNGFETESMADAFLHEEERVDNYEPEGMSASPFAYLRRGHYHRFLRGFERHVPRQQMKILLFERLTKEPEEVAELFRFLGVAETFLPQRPAHKVNASRARDRTGLSPDLERRLAATFREPNRKLAESYGLDLSPWSPCEH